MTSAGVKAYTISCSNNLSIDVTNPVIYLKLWNSICIPSLLYGCELWSLGVTQLTRLEGLQRWFIRRVMLLPKRSYSIPTIRCAELLSVESQIAGRKLLYFARVITRDREGLVHDIFEKRMHKCINSSISSLGYFSNFIALFKLYELEGFL